MTDRPVTHLDTELSGERHPLLPGGSTQIRVVHHDAAARPKSPSGGFETRFEGAEAVLVDPLVAEHPPRERALPGGRRCDENHHLRSAVASIGEQIRVDFGPRLVK